MHDLVDYTTGLTEPSRWTRFEHRPGDIVISTPSKCGTTWMQMLCGLLIFDTPDLPAPLDALSPWLDMRLSTEQEVFERLDGQGHRRFIKTHTPLDGMPFWEDVTYVVVGRDPRDAMVSFEYHMANIDMEKIVGRLASQGRLAELEAGLPPGPPDPDPAVTLRAFIEDGGVQNEEPTLAGVLNHLNAAWELRHRPNVGLFHYADLQCDLIGEMGRLARLLGITTSEERLRQLAPAASLDTMRASADKVAPEATFDVWRDPAAFFRTGGSGEWADRGTPQDHQRYHERVAELAAPDLASWAHLGSYASSINPAA